MDAPALAESGAGEAGALDLHEGISDPGRQTARETACERWPQHHRLRGSGPDGVQYVKGRCKCTNLCSYCRTLYVVETVEMLTLDAMEWAPTIWVVLTARNHLTRKQTYRPLEQMLRAARRRWPAIEWFVQVEFQRRGALHLNLLVKGVPVSELEELYAVLVRVWCERPEVDALPVRGRHQWIGAIEDARSTVSYLSKMLAHGLKAEQQPPIGWRGHRTSQTRGYLVRAASEMRVEAKRALKLKRLLREGVPGDMLERELELRDAIVWELVDVRRPHGEDGRGLIEPDLIHVAGAPRYADVLQVASARGTAELALEPGQLGIAEGARARPGVDEVEVVAAVAAVGGSHDAVHARSLRAEADGP